MIKKHIPNSITCCNLISGCIATYFAFRHDFEWALAWMVIGAVFDFFDGMTARLLHVSSPIGKELDSLADDITFGLAPSAMLFAELGVVAYPSVLELCARCCPSWPSSWRPFQPFAWPSSISTSASPWASSDCPPRPMRSSGAR